MRMTSYMIDESGMMEESDLVKALVLNALVRDGLLDEKEADEWAINHTILVRKPKLKLFRSIFKKKDEEIDNRGFLYQIVKAV